MKTTMFDILKERLEEEEIIKFVSNYDNKFCELEEENTTLNKKLTKIKKLIEDYKKVYPNLYFIILEDILNIINEGSDK